MRRSKLLILSKMYLTFSLFYLVDLIANVFNFCAVLLCLFYTQRLKHLVRFYLFFSFFFFSQSKNVNLTCVRNCVVVAEERPRINLTSAFSTLFSGLGLSPRAVSTSFGCRVNVAICTQVRERTPPRHPRYFHVSLPR